MSATEDQLDQLLTEQVAYYRARAGEYDATAGLDGDTEAELKAALRVFGARGKVLELACGTGKWTAELASTADELTAIDASPEMLELNRRRLDRGDVRYHEADLFAWEPSERYDVVFFAAWLSHVPPQRFARFWGLVDAALTDRGRVFAIDELPAVDAFEHRTRGPTSAVGRRLRSGQSFRAVKVLYEPAELERRLLELGWRLRVTTVDWRVFYATGQRACAPAPGGSTVRSRSG